MNKIFPYAVALLVVVGLGIAGLFFTGVLSGDKSSTRSSVIAGAPQIGGAFSLTNHLGQPVTDKDFHGKMMLVFFGYTYCPDVCPTEMQTFALVMNGLGDAAAENVVPVFISVDPKRDTEEVMKEFVASFHPSIVGLTGSDEQITAVKKMYRAYSAKVNEEDDPKYYLVDHTSFTYLMGRDGNLETVFSYGATPEEIIKQIKDRI